MYSLIPFAVAVVFYTRGYGSDCEIPTVQCERPYTDKSNRNLQL